MGVGFLKRTRPTATKTFFCYYFHPRPAQKSLVTDRKMRCSIHGNTLLTVKNKRSGNQYCRKLHCITAYEQMHFSSVKEILCASKQFPCSSEIKRKEAAITQSTHFETNRNLFSSGKIKRHVAKTGIRAKSMCQRSTS